MPSMPNPTRVPKSSSGVTFKPHSKYWRIGGQYYDFKNFEHPGGTEILHLARDRFNDCTYAFESHHMNYARARGIIRKYQVEGTVQKEMEEEDGHVSSECPKLLGEEAFYSDVRRRVRGYFKSIGLDKVCPGPTRQCVALFWLVFLAWAAGLLCLLLITPTIPTAVLCGVLASFLGAFGHNWIHQPDYKHYAYLSLDLIGFSSDGWYREHLLQHHMYTNTPLDNHFKGTDPFIVTDPTVARNWFQSHLSPLLNPLFLTCGLWGNYTAHLVEILKGNEKFVLWKLFLPSLVYTFYRAHGGFGLILMYFYAGTMGIYYFTMALMNHNSEKTLNVGLRNTADDWGKAQIVSCADWAVQTPFLPSIIYLWLNYHCVHHLFPLVDFSHHRPVQKILMETCRDHGVVYEAGEFWDIYRQMVKGFATPSSLFKEINAYNGS